MHQLVKKHISCIGLLALLIMSIGLPAQAQFTKLYQFTHQTGVDQTSVKATTQGLESIISQSAVPSTWLPATTGTALITGVYNTTLKTFPGLLWAATFFRANKPMAEFAASEGAQSPPQVKF